MAKIPIREPKSINDNRNGTLFYDNQDKKMYMMNNGYLVGITEKLPEGWINVKDFGAKGDGITDDTAAIQAAINNGHRIYFPHGNYIISQPLTFAKSGVKLFGESEYTTTIIPSSDFSGDALISAGDGSISYYGIDIFYLGFNGNGVSDIKGIKFNRCNQVCKIWHCYFEDLDTAIYFTNLSLGNRIYGNKFFNNTTDVWLEGSAGNSTLIDGNNEFKGRVFLDDAMTDIKIVNNTFDANGYIYTAGQSGPRGVKIINNRFELTIDRPMLEFGIIRGCQIANNMFQGNGIVTTAIEFKSSITENTTIQQNYFEGITTNLVLNSGNNPVFLINNGSDGSGVYNGKVIELGNQNGTFNIPDNTITYGSSQKIIELYIEKTLTANSPTDVAKIINNDNEPGGYSVTIEGCVIDPVNSTATTSRAIVAIFVHANGNDGRSANSAVLEIAKTDAASTLSTSRDITDINVSASSTDTETTISITADITNPSIPRFLGVIRVMWSGYATPPTLISM